MAHAQPFEGTFFRSVAYRYFHPDDVISGEGTRRYGGRFVPVGISAVYGSVDEQTAVQEVSARQQMLKGNSQVDFRDYPRLTYVLHVKTERHLDISGDLPSDLNTIIQECSQPGDHEASQRLAELWIAEGVESVLFRSATGSGKNVLVYTTNAGEGSVAVANREALLSKMRSRLSE